MLKDNLNLLSRLPNQRASLALAFKPSTMLVTPTKSSNCFTSKQKASVRSVDLRLLVSLGVGLDGGRRLLLVALEPELLLRLKLVLQVLETGLHFLEQRMVILTLKFKI